MLRFKKWFKRNGLKLVSISVTVAGVVLIIYKMELSKGKDKSVIGIIPDLKSIEEDIKDIASPIISKDILNDLTGNMLTARALGNKIGCSAQAINKRIVEAGLAKKLPCGDYIMTEAGRLFGKDTWKETASGHSFSNIEWDEKILQIICSPDELIKAS